MKYLQINFRIANPMTNSRSEANKRNTNKSAWFKDEPEVILDLYQNKIDLDNLRTATEKYWV